MPDPHKIDRLICYGNNGLTLLGIWHLDPENELFGMIDDSIRFLRDAIIKQPENNTFTTAHVASSLKIDAAEAENILYWIVELGGFNDSATFGGKAQCSSITWSEGNLNNFLY